ncbi:MAG: hypothetical protein ACJ8AG_19000 [Ktedonobacteraceae bacterium]
MVRREEEQARCHGYQLEHHPEDSDQGTASVRVEVPCAQAQQHDSHTAHQQDEQAHDRGEGSDNLLHRLVSDLERTRESLDRFPLVV